MKYIIYLILCVFILRFFSACNAERNTLFQAVSSDKSGILFSNELEPDDSLNILDYNYFYNGGGVAAADFNNDGFTDLYFTGNKVSSRLYLNKGDLSFLDITDKAGVNTKNWATGIAVADINNDGLQDMYISYAGYKNPQRRVNQLFINQGLGKDNVPVFKDEAIAYGLADTNYTTQSAFIDFDRDGDLDLLLLNHYQDLTNPNYPKVKVKDGASSSNARLYQNEGGHFTEISKAAGLLEEGYSLSTSICDINKDGWPDIYIAKDFVYDDALYINNKNGTFTESIHKYLAHTSQFSMGCDIADYNNDGYLDIVTMDMLPDDNKRQKLMNIAMNNDRFNYILQLGYMPQYSRNMLQLNNGPDAEGNYSFSEIGQLADIYKTDWSWSALFVDLDNDGWKDLYVTNGIPHDITNNDFVTYRAEKIMNSNTDINILKSQVLSQIESLEPVNKPNFVFKNNKDLQFTDQSENWGLAQRGFSNGAVYVDLDNDGDLDLVTNNLNAPASIYLNRSRQKNNYNFIRIKLEGPFSIGAKISISCKGKSQYIEHNTCRGFQSSQEPIDHFGLGNADLIDTLKIVWLDGKVQVLTNIKPNQVLKLYYKNASEQSSIIENQQVQPLLSNITFTTGVNFTHFQKPFEDFNHEPLLPHRFSVNGPYIAAGDVDKNGFEDFWLSGPARVPGKLFLQQASGSFISRDMPDSGYEDMGGVFFDADGDQDLDLYVVSGGNIYNPLTAPYQDRLYVNNSKGKFDRAPDALPIEYSSGSVVAARDYDKDGDIDLFVGGRVLPTKYPLSPESFILRNNGKGKFINSTDEVCPQLSEIGMVTSALWTDFDNDGWSDLIIAGEWMPISFFKNNKGILRKSEMNPGILSSTGWWFSLAEGDFDKDGDMDYLAGNLGLNNRFNVSDNTPLSVYGKDFDDNGMLECILTYYLNGKEYTLVNRDQIASVMPSIKKKFDNYTKFSEVDFAGIFSKNELKDVFKLAATNLSSAYIENKGAGEFVLHTLPMHAQFSVIQSIIVHDYDEDGYLDALIAGNFYNPDFMTGRYDASIGLLLKGNGKGGFFPVPPSLSGIHVTGDTRSLQKIQIAKKMAIIAGVNKGKVQIYGHKTKLPAFTEK